MFLSDFVPEVGREELIEQVKVRMISGAVLTSPDGDDLLREEVGLNAPILPQPHNHVLNEVLVVVEEFRLVGIEEVETSVVVDSPIPALLLHCDL